MQKPFYLKFGQDDRVILSSSEFSLEDFDTSPSDVTIVMRNLTSTATLQKNDGAGNYTSITRENDASYAFALEDFQQGLIAVYLSDPAGKKVEFTLEAIDSNGNRNDISKSNIYQKGARSFSFDVVEPLSSKELEVDLQTGYQKAFPLGRVEPVIEKVRARTSRGGVLHVVLENGVSGDLLEMHKSVSGVRGRWRHREHRYTLTVSDGTTTSERIAEALAAIYYRARESAAEQPRELVVSWIDATSSETLLFDVPLANRPPVLRNWGLAARYHDITLVSGATETPLDLGYHPYREYMPEILDNEGEVVRLEVVLTDKAGGVLSADERVFLPQELRDQMQAQGLVLRELRSSDNKARALAIEAADGKTPVSPEFMSQVVQGLQYHHGAIGRAGDVGERRRISVAAFDGEAYSQTLTMEVRLVNRVPNPARYVNTFIGTSKQFGMGVSSGTGNQDNEAGMTFPGAAYPFGAVRLTPDTDQPIAYGGYRHDKDVSGMGFVLTAFSGPGCAAAKGGKFSVGAGETLTSAADRNSQRSEAGYYKVLLRGVEQRVELEAAASSPRTATMRLNLQEDGLNGFIFVRGSVQFLEQDDHWVFTYDTTEEGVCIGDRALSTFYVSHAYREASGGQSVRWGGDLFYFKREPASGGCQGFDVLCFQRGGVAQHLCGEP